MRQVNIDIIMDEDLKQQAEALFCDLGMDLSAAFNMFVEQAVREWRFPFEITTDDDFNNNFNQQHLMKTIDGYDKSRLVVKSVEELDRLLDE